MVTYRPLQLYIDGSWIDTGVRATGPVLNPATGEEIGRVPFATPADLDRALDASDRAFRSWRKVPAVQRAAILHKAAALIRERTDRISHFNTLEQGKTIGESMWETGATADAFDWSAEEGRRTYGRIIPPRYDGVQQLAIKEPIGPAACFSPWNGPALLFGRKIAEALAAGCSCIVKPAEETPATALEIVHALVDAGVPPGVVNIVFGVPSDISTHLISSPIIRKVSFTGSVEVGRTLARLAGEHLKRITLELGGHGPVVVCDDVNVDQVVEQAVGAKFFVAGQICVSPTRFLVHESIHEKFVRAFSERAAAIKLGDGFDPTTQMGPLANQRRLAAMEGLVADARQRGACVATGGRRRGSRGFFFEPTVLSNVPLDSNIMNREPFGPVIAANPFSNLDEAIREANRLPYGLAAYAFTRSATVKTQLADAFESGLVGVNTFGIADSETPFGGVKNSGLGTEGGMEGVAAYLVTKFVAMGA